MENPGISCLIELKFMLTRSKSRQQFAAEMACTAHIESILPKYTGYDAEDPELWIDRYERYASQ